MQYTFDTIGEALAHIEILRANKVTGYLTANIIETVLDKYGHLEELLCQWTVTTREESPRTLYSLPLTLTKESQATLVALPN